MNDKGISLGQSTATRESDRALLVQIEASVIGLKTGGTVKIWVPKSQIHDDSEVFQNGQSGKLVVTEWLAKEKGWTI